MSHDAGSRTIGADCSIVVGLVDCGSMLHIAHDTAGHALVALNLAIVFGVVESYCRCQRCDTSCIAR